MGTSNFVSASFEVADIDVDFSELYGMTAFGIGFNDFNTSCKIDLLSLLIASHEDPVKALVDKRMNVRLIP